MKLLNFKSVFILLSLELIGLFSADLSFSKNKYFDTEEDMKFRQDYISNYTNLITKGKVAFDYSPGAGTYCKAKKNLSSKEFVFKVPKEFLICGFDIFPFKFEIKEVVHNYLNNKYRTNVNETKTKTGLFVFAYSLLFHKLADKPKIFKYLNESSRSYYIKQLNDKQQGYLDSLSATLYTQHMYDDEERKLCEFVGLPTERQSELHEIWSVVEKHFKKDFESEYIHHWVSDFHMFKYFTGIISSRSYKTTLLEYEKLHHKSLLDFPAGGQQKQLLNDISTDFSWSCLLPFIDLCNHKKTDDPNGSDLTQFFLVFSQDFVKIAFSDAFTAEQEYSYSYLPNGSNEKLLLSYGFYFDNNSLSTTGFETSIFKQFFSKEKYEICKKINCLEGNYDSFYLDPSLKEAPIKITLSPHKMTANYLNAMRLYVEPATSFNATNFERRLKRRKVISYNNEMTALGLYMFTIHKADTLAQLSSIDIVNTIQLTKNFYKAHREDIIKNQFLRYKFRMRRRIANVALENRMIFIKNEDMAQTEIFGLLKDQFTKLKSAILQQRK